jgi:hypothetical protein
MLNLLVYFSNNSGMPAHLYLAADNYETSLDESQNDNSCNIIIWKFSGNVQIFILQSLGSFYVGQITEFWVSELGLHLD